jgi:hypothetical protein
MMLRAEGDFEVKNVPLPADDVTADTAIDRYALNKQYRGGLEASAKGEMLGAGDPASGAAGYVAMEEVTGSLLGRTGSFTLQHSGTMQNGKFELKVHIVPGTGTSELQGIAGTMTFIIAGAKHSYTLDYTVPASL